jgi:ribose transport system substrate-binding protein
MTAPIADTTPRVKRRASRRVRRTLPVIAGIACLALLAACGSSSTSSSSTSPSASDAGAAGVAKAQQMVTQYQALTTNYPVPTGSVSNVASLKGKTVYYIPLASFIPTFAAMGAALKLTFAKVGMTVQICDGKTQPSAIAACVQQAVAANAAGMILDAIPYGMAQNALDSAKSKGIPIIIADQVAPAGTTNSNELAWISGPTDMPSQQAWWNIAHSNGNANVIIAEETDNPSAIGYAEASRAIYAQNCPNCKVTVKQVTATTNALLASQTSSNILANPNVDYYVIEFEDSLQPTMQGIQQSGKSSSINASVGAATTFGLGLVASGKAALKAGVAVDNAYGSWAFTDQMLRMATKSGPVDESIPTRLFDSTNIGSIQVTPAAQAAGTWWGDNSYQAKFLSLWGVSS